MDFLMAPAPLEVELSDRNSADIELQLKIL